MDRSEKPPRLVFLQEIPLHENLFAETPLLIIKMYLECFDRQGHQAFSVPQHVLEALAGRFLRLMDGETGSLDQAFGGCVARQRNRLKAEDSDWVVLWKLLSEWEAVKSEPISKRGAGTPFEIAAERVAKRLGMSPDNVNRIYKKSAKR